MGKTGVKPAKEALWWSGFLTLCFGHFWLYYLVVGKEYKSFELLLKMRKINLSAINEMLVVRSLFDLLGFVFCIFLCLLWYRLSKKRIRRGKVAYFFGSLIFAVVTFFLPFFLGAKMEEYMRDLLNSPISNGQFVNRGFLFSAGSISVCAAALFLAYFLNFKKYNDS